MPGSVPSGMPNYWINTANLNLVVEDTDFSYKGLGPKISMTRTYNADPSYSGMFGKSWSFSYEAFIDESGQSDATKTVMLTKGSGQGIRYSIDLSKTPPVEGTPPEGVYDRLTWYGNHWLFEEKATRWTYRYDKVAGTNLSRLTSITDPDGNEVDIDYNPDGTIQGITDAVGRETGFTYDANKHCISMTTPNGGQATYAYDGSGNLVKTVDLLGFEADYQYNSAGYMVAMTVGMKTIQFSWDSGIPGWTRIASVTDALGNVTHYTVNSSDYSVSISDALGGMKSYKSENGRNIELVDQLGNQMSKTYSKGHAVEIKDSKGNVTRMEYDSKGNLTKFTDLLENVTTYVFDANDNLISKTDPLGNTWTYTYDDYHHLTKLKSPLGNETMMAYDELGQLFRITDARGNIAAFTYDDFGNVETVADPLGNKTSMSYDPSGINRTSITDARGNKTQFAYDKNDRLTKVTHPDGTFRAYTYDCCANSSVTDENGNTTTFVRDSLLYITEITDPMGKITKRGYDKNSNLVSITDALEHTATRAYDASNRLISATNPRGQTVQVSYDPNGNFISLKDERRKQTTFTYDYNNLQLSTTDPLGHGVTEVRDALGRVITVTNARGGKIDFTYDADGRITKKTYNGVTVASYGYDVVGNLITVTDSTGTTTYAYDARNQVTGITYPDGKTLSVTYDPVGNISSIAYPGGLLVNYTYDNRNRVASMAWDGNSITYTYDGVGNVTRGVRSNGTETTHVYDANDHVTQIQHKKGLNTFAQMTFTRDEIGNTTNETRTLPLAPLITTQSISTDYNDVNQITKWGPNNYTYDNDGNLTSITGAESFSATYDLENRPTAITRDGITTTYTYDGIGHRTKAVKVSQTRNYNYGPYGRPMFETDGSGSVIASYIYRGGRLVGIKSSSGEGYFYHFEKTGNTIALTDSSGSIANAYAYEPFGRVSNHTGAVYNPFTYVGAYGVMDEGGGLYFMKNRYYDANTDKFIQKDPIGFRGGINLYRYVGNNPVNYIDPSGYLSKEWSYRPPPQCYTPWQLPSGAAKTAAEVTDNLAEIYSNAPTAPYNNLVGAIRDFAHGEVADGVIQGILEVLGKTGNVIQIYTTFFTAGIDKPFDDPTAKPGSGDWLLQMEAKGVRLPTVSDPVNFYVPPPPEGQGWTTYVPPPPNGEADSNEQE